MREEKNYNLQALAEELRAAEAEHAAAKEREQEADRAEWKARQRVEAAAKALRDAVDKVAPPPKRGQPVGDEA